MIGPRVQYAHPHDRRRWTRTSPSAALALLLAVAGAAPASAVSAPVPSSTWVTSQVVTMRRRTSSRRPATKWERACRAGL